MSYKHQRYKIQLIYESDGKWSVAGFWERPSDTQLSPGIGQMRWDLDGEKKYFETKLEAIEFIANQKGIPE